MKTRQFQDPGIVHVLLADVRFAGIWLVLRLYLGWVWLDAGWRWLDDPTRMASQNALTRLMVVGETLAGIALILGILTGLAAVVGGLLSNAVLTGTIVMTPALFIVVVGLVLAWKTAGWIGLDRWLLPALGMPWDGGQLFRAKLLVLEGSKRSD